MRIFLSALGCRLNEAESASWSRQLRALGHQTTSKPEHADIMVLNSCAVTAEAVRKTRKRVSRLNRRNPQGKLLLTGCYASLHPESAATLPGVDHVLINAEKEQLPQFIAGLSSRVLASPVKSVRPE